MSLRLLALESELVDPSLLAGVKYFKMVFGQADVFSVCSAG
jgi:hypothetical protein